jgi:agmatinase
MVANRWPDGESFASIPRDARPAGLLRTATALAHGRSEEGAHSTMPDELRRRRQNDEEPAAAHQDPYTAYHDFDLPAYVGSTSFQKLPVVTDGAALRERRPDVAIVGAPFDDAVSHRPGARFGPRAIRTATYHSGSLNSLQLGIEPFEWLDCVDTGDAPVTPANIERGHEVIRRKVLEVASSGAIPIVLGGDHSITFPAASAVAETIRPKRLGVVHFDAHADAANSTWGVLRSHGTPMRRLIESGVVEGHNFVQVGLRGYWPPAETLSWMREQQMRWHLMTEIESRGAEDVVADAIGEALDGPEVIYLSVDIDVLDPGLAPGTGTPEPGGLLTRELLRAIRQVVSAVELAAMDVVEVAPPYDHAEVTSSAAHRCVMEAISALAARRRDRGEPPNPTRL